MEPLLEPAVLVSENCPDCRGLGRRVTGVSGPQGRLHFPTEADYAVHMARHEQTVPCERCEGAGREVREVPLSEFITMAADAHTRLVAPPPSELRERARRGA